MNMWAILALVVVVLAVIFSNVLLLKKTANQKFGSKLTDANRRQNGAFDDEDDDWGSPRD